MLISTTLGGKDLGTYWSGIYGDPEPIGIKQDPLQ